MNNVSQVVTTLLHYLVAVRDTLEYCLPKDSYDVNLYNEKKRSILVEVDQHTPLKDILDRSEENGKNLEKLIREFHAEVYGDDSRIVKVADDGIRVDHSLHQNIYKYVLPIHENVNAMVLGILADAHKNNIDVAEVEKVAAAEEAMYRGVAYMTLVRDLNKLFGEYNQARNEAKGAETPASNFIGKDIQTMVGNINFVRGNAKVTDLVYKNMEDRINVLVEEMTGRRQLPVGKKFPDEMNGTVESINLYVRDAEANFRACYPQIIKELIDQVNAAKAEAEAAKAA